MTHGLRMQGERILGSGITFLLCLHPIMPVYGGLFGPAVPLQVYSDWGNSDWTRARFDWKWAETTSKDGSKSSSWSGTRIRLCVFRLNFALDYHGRQIKVNQILSVWIHFKGVLKLKELYPFLLFDNTTTVALYLSAAHPLFTSCDYRLRWPFSSSYFGPGIDRI